MKYRIVDADNRAEYSKPKTLKRSKRGLSQTQRLKRIKGAQNMREFKIYGEIGSNPDTPKFRAFVKNIETEINENEEIVNRSKKCNIEFSDKLKEILNNPENLLYTGSMVSGLQFTTPRYSYIKHLEFDGKEYEAEIDELEHKFYLFEIED